ncbi:unnamed protein product [Phytophthora lilii]|uniref:Unnamed protein product n=1 Tax=Phytophthora lilii TaxID=2077276 RepID=A0A9W6TQM2_9STRA|nr:unnamed protein product [Phytophthora lilii]
MQEIEFLRPRMRDTVVGPALEVAAGNGDLRMVEALLPGPLLMHNVFGAAAADGHLQVVQFLLETVLELQLHPWPRRSTAENPRTSGSPGPAHCTAPSIVFGSSSSLIRSKA